MSADASERMLTDPGEATNARFPSQAHTRKIIFAVTFACDKRCCHCAVTSELSSASCLQLEQFERLLADLRRLGVSGDVTIGFTGGEPMLYRYRDHTLASLVSKAAEACFRRIDIQSSGWGGNPKDYHYHQVFNCICDNRDDLDLSFNLSFNEYQDAGAEERIIYTVSSLWDAGFDPSVIAAVDVETYITTYLRFYLLAISKLGAAPEVDFDVIAASWHNGLWDFAPKRFNRGSRYVVFKPSVTVQIGRAASLDHRFFIARNRCKNILDGEHCLLFDPTGRVFVCDKPHVYEYMRPVGNFHTQSTDSIVRNAEHFRGALLRRLRTVSAEHQVCEECRAFCRIS